MVGSMRVDLKKTILRLVKARNTVKLWCFDQPAGSVVAPPMVAATEHSRCSGLFSSDCIGTVSTHIVERSNLIILTADQEDRESSNVKGLICPSLAKLSNMGKIQP